MYGTKSSVTPANGSSSTMSRPSLPSVRWRTSSKSSSLRWPPEKPAVNSPAIVPPTRMSGWSLYSSQNGSLAGSKFGIFETSTYGRKLWYWRMYVHLRDACTSLRKVVLPLPDAPTTTVNVM